VRQKVPLYARQLLSLHNMGMHNTKRSRFKKM